MTRSLLYAAFVASSLVAFTGGWMVGNHRPEPTGQEVIESAEYRLDMLCRSAAASLHNLSIMPNVELMVLGANMMTGPYALCLTDDQSRVRFIKTIEAMGIAFLRSDMATVRARALEASEMIHPRKDP